MRNNIETTIGKFSTQIEKELRFVSTLAEIIVGMRKFIVQTKREQSEVSCQKSRKNQMKIQLRQDTISQMSLDQKLKMRLLRF